MKILAIDTATEACSAALMIDGEILSHYQVAPREHSRLILKMIDDLLLQANNSISDVDAIAFGRGPGSFMGLRIAAGVVQGLAFAHDIPVIPVSSLKAIAQRVYSETQNKNVLVAIDARMDEVYWAAYYFENQKWLLNGEEQVISPDKVVLPVTAGRSEKQWAAAGTGWASYQDRLLPLASDQLTVMLPECLPSAEAIALLAIDDLQAGRVVSAAQAIPVYLRNDVAKKPKPVVF